MFVSDHYRVTATRNSDGSIEIEDELLKEAAPRTVLNPYKEMGRKLARLPFIRGVVELVQKSYENKLTATLNGILLFIGVSSLFLPSSSTDGSHFEVLSWSLFLLALVVAACVLFLVFEIIFGPTGKYHAAEHMVANTLERGWKLTVSNVLMQSRNQNIGKKHSIGESTSSVYQYSMNIRVGMVHAFCDIIYIIGSFCL